MTADELIDAILVREGSVYTNDPADRGGPTKYGITLATLAAYRKPIPVNAYDVESLRADEARAIYWKQYVVAPHFDEITDDGLRAALVDFGVNSGPDRAIHALQYVLGMKADGILGTKTLARANETNGRTLTNQLAVARLKFLVGLAVEDPSQLKWLRGWVNRAASFIIF